jgi:hypothetical protein
MGKEYVGIDGEAETGRNEDEDPLAGEVSCVSPPFPPAGEMLHLRPESEDEEERRNEEPNCIEGKM